MQYLLEWISYILDIARGKMRVVMVCYGLCLNVSPKPHAVISRDFWGAELRWQIDNSQLQWLHEIVNLELNIV